ncbi:MAG: hypothetical protein ABH832_03420 [bacterium]
MKAKLTKISVAITIVSLIAIGGGVSYTLYVSVGDRNSNKSQGDIIDSQGVKVEHSQVTVDNSGSINNSVVAGSLTVNTGSLHRSLVSDDKYKKQIDENLPANKEIYIPILYLSGDMESKEFAREIDDYIRSKGYLNTQRKAIMGIWENPKVDLQFNTSSGSLGIKIRSNG